MYKKKAKKDPTLTEEAFLRQMIEKWNEAKEEVNN
jgi:hypothetical protein